MKTWGWILSVLGGLSLLGTIIGGSNPIGPLFWLGLGLFLLYRAKQKEEDKKGMDEWDKK